MPVTVAFAERLRRRIDIREFMVKIDTAKLNEKQPADLPG